MVTEPRLISRGEQPGQSYTYPLSVLPNLKYTGTVTLTASGTPAGASLEARIEPATVTVAGEQTATMTVTVPAGAKDIVAPRVKVTLGQATTVRLVMKNGQLVLE